MEEGDGALDCCAGSAALTPKLSILRAVAWIEPGSSACTFVLLHRLSTTRSNTTAFVSGAQIPLFASYHQHLDHLLHGQLFENLVSSNFSLFLYPFPFDVEPMRCLNRYICVSATGDSAVA